MYSNLFKFKGQRTAKKTSRWKSISFVFIMVLLQPSLCRFGADAPNPAPTSSEDTRVAVVMTPTDPPPEPSPTGEDRLTDPPPEPSPTGEDRPTDPPPEPTATEEDQPPVGPIPLDGGQPFIFQPDYLFYLENSIHIGDEEFSNGDWTSLSGECWDVVFDAQDQFLDLTLYVQTYGAEANNSIMINGVEVGLLPNQEPREDESYPNWWTETIGVQLDSVQLNAADNVFTICARQHPVDPDLDDFQLRSTGLQVNSFSLDPELDLSHPITIEFGD